MMRPDRAHAAILKVSVVLSSVFAAVGVLTHNPYMFVAPLLLSLYNIAVMLGAILTELVNQREGKGE